ncbi:sugar ABC transporter permease [Acrocarpospora pleiomorpha]|uniref:Sugar ABC transporter permease n=1 Tax=Acrocarpospora pleiomorpha TaxID=90975 RepID=A0A5M3XC72_9ACTN|nr:carbohydrate ABC transporter permease [Acrocarpospora pleiomorpha]GES18730.1 sugar ABC transporter permease [Acrocarpospora pleiomorpha]
MTAALFRPRPGAGKAARHLLICLLLAFLLYPLAVLLLASFSEGGVIGSPGGLILENYRAGWQGDGGASFATYFVNSALISLASIVGVLLSCSVAAYAFARIEFPGRRILFALMIGTLLLPAQVTVVPQYIMFNTLGMVDTYWPLTLTHYFAVDAFYTFLMVQFIRGISPSLDEAARIDGCGHIGIFFRVIMPLSMPALATTAAFCFVHSWNDFLGPLLYLNDPGSFTVPLGLRQFMDATGNSNTGGLLAMSVLSLVPLIAFFAVAQRLITEGISTTGLK